MNLELSSDQAELIKVTLNKVADDYLAKSETIKSDELINNILYQVQTELGL